MQVRVYLTGRMAVETSAGIADEAQFPGRQGRLAFAFLGLSAQRPVARDALGDAIWGPELPAAWESALKSIMSKLRSLLKMVGLSDAIGSVSGCYQLRLPVESWIDLEAAVRAVDVAEGAIRRHVIDEAWSEATVATAIARRPLLPGEDAPWIDDVRLRLTATHVRALEVLAQVWLQRRNAPLAMAASAEAVGLEPFRESGYRLLMEAHALAGNRAEAIRTYDRCARVLADEVGVEPDPETTALRDRVNAGTATRPLSPQMVTIAVTDIVGSTALAAQLGDERWREVLREHDDITHACVEVAGGQVVKHLGDGFLLTFASASSALNALDQLRRGLAESRFHPPLTIRAGLHAGEPIADDEDLFGLQVNIAARISALAEPHEILVSSVIRDLSAPGRTEFSAPRSVVLKGIPDEITVCTAKPTTRSP
jgi:SARP family transcriptional regulator, regulator of embCAB operon